MVGVTDEVILKNSSGQVTKNIEPAKTDGLTGTILDSEMFGTLEGSGHAIDKNINKIGHIELPIPIVNIQYIRGSSPILTKMLGMTLKQVEDIIYYKDAVVISSELDGYEFGETISLEH